jgi:glyoxylase-like metal-dependent hydrolase (beta-lactamase superfamily II)
MILLSHGGDGTSDRYPRQVVNEHVLPANVHEIDLFRVRSHAIVEDDGVTLIDAGRAGSLDRIQRGLEVIGVSIDDVRRVICTHGHPDHAGGARALADRGIDVLIHPADAANLQIGYRDVARHPSRGRIFAAMTPPLDTSLPIVDGDVLPILGGLEVVHTPGHTPGSVCLYAQRDGLLFVGDALQHRFGRVSFASGLYSDDAAEARSSVKRMAALDVMAIVFAHYPPLVEGARATLERLARLAQ